MVNKRSEKKGSFDVKQWVQSQPQQGILERYSLMSEDEEVQQEETT